MTYDKCTEIQICVDDRLSIGLVSWCTLYTVFSQVYDSVSMSLIECPEDANQLVQEFRTPMKMCGVCTFYGWTRPDDVEG